MGYNGNRCAASNESTAMPVPASLTSEEEIERLSELGAAIYEERLKSFLEPIHNGEWVAIHVDTGDCALGKNSPRALDALRKKRPTGLVVTMLIGPERDDPTLHRMLASQMIQQRK